MRGARLIHGHNRRGKQTREYTAWFAMLRRCKVQKSYVEKGIKVCDLWRESFIYFLVDVGLAPSPKHELDRYPNRNGNYEPGNVRWATRKENMRNRDEIVLVTYKGETKPLQQWCEELGLKHRRRNIDWRLRNRWSPEEAFTKRSQRDTIS